MRIQLGKTAKTQPQASTGLGLDTRGRYQEQLLANVQHSSKYAFDQSGSSTSLAEHELMELQRLVAGGPQSEAQQPEAPVEFEEQPLPFAFNPMFNPMPEEQSAPPMQIEEEQPAPVFQLAEEQPASIIPMQEEQPLFVVATPEEEPTALFRNNDDNKLAQELYNQPAEIGRTQRGTIEFVIQEDGRKLVPEYNKCGILTGIDFGEGTKLTQDAGDGSWCLVSANNIQQLSIKSVAFDKDGTLSINSSY
jgi:hypothetical protein